MEKYCQNCRQKNSPDAQFCRFCAAPLASGAQTAHNQGHYQNPQWNQGFAGSGQQFAGHPSAGSSGRAIASVLLSIFGFLLCCALTSIPGAILGWLEVTAIREGRSSPAGLKMAQIGLWGGVIVTILNLLVYGFYFLMMMMSSSAMYY